MDMYQASKQLGASGNKHEAQIEDCGLGLGMSLSQSNPLKPKQAGQQEVGFYKKIGILHKGLNKDSIDKRLNKNR